jgi:hypothetical protein
MTRVLKAALPFVLLTLVLVSVGYWRQRALEARLGRAEAQINLDASLDVSLSDVQALRSANIDLASRLDGIESNAAQLQKQLSLVQQILQYPEGVTISDVQSALDNGTLNVPASAVSTPIFCDGRPAAWSGFGAGLGC